jgi:serine/threonine protein kinase
MSPEQDGPRKGRDRQSPSTPPRPNSAQGDAFEVDASEFATFKPPAQEDASEFATFKPPAQEESGDDTPEVSSRTEKTLRRVSAQDDELSRRRQDKRESAERRPETKSELQGPISRFEREWERGGEPPRIEDFLSHAGAHRATLFVALAQADLKYHLRAGKAPQAEDYLKRYPGLRDEEAADLIVGDYEMRRRHGIDVTAREYLQRFPRLKSLLAGRLASIDSNDPGVAETMTIHPRHAPIARPAPTPTFPSKLLAKFEPIEELGAGGMGMVWRVRHRELREERAVKLIHPHVARDEVSLERLRREAQAMARVRHPHAVAVYDVCMDEVPYIEMEYLPGQSLNKVLKPKVPLPLKQIAQIVEQLCDALQYAHDRQIIHRDLKPSNLLLVDGGPSEKIHLKVLDFGLAKFLGVSHDRTLTRPGLGLGTPAYMSPEQIDESMSVDARSDLFTVGVILYELLVGYRPFTSPKYYGLMYEITRTPAPPFKVRNPDAKVAPAIETFVLRCLEKEPSRRPSSARELAEEFLRLAGPEISDHPGDGVARSKLGRRWFLAGAAGLGLAGVWWYWKPQGSRSVSAPFTISPTKLIIKGGQSKFVRITVPPGYLTAQIAVEVGLPTEIVVRRGLPDYDSERVFEIEVDPNIHPQTRQIKFSTPQGQTLSTELAIEAPQLARLPRNWEPAPNPAFVKLLINEEWEIYPRIIERKFPKIDRPVVARLVEKKPNRSGQPDPFYIMEDKVWVELFQLFADENPKMIQSSGWKNGQNKLWPALGVSGEEAEKFATWLGGRLPTTEQWDQAAGKNWDAEGWTWPFQKAADLAENWKSGVAAGKLLQPWNVGKASQDISPYKCRDMSGNGIEWTRLKDGETTPFLVELRAASHRDAKPFSFKELEKAGSGFFHRSRPETGFRVVIELPVPKE